MPDELPLTYVDPSRIAVPKLKAERDAMHRDALAALLPLLTPVEREAVERSLEDPSLGSVGSVQGNPEIARLLSVLYAIQNANADDAQLAKLQGWATIYEAQVTIAVVESFDSPDTSARIHRHRGANLIVIRRASLSEAHIAAALATISRSRLQQGHLLGEPLTIDLPAEPRVPPLSEEQRAMARSAKEELLAAPSRMVPGFGDIPAISLTLPPEPPPRSSS